ESLAAALKAWPRRLDAVAWRRTSIAWIARPDASAEPPKRPSAERRSLTARATAAAAARAKPAIASWGMGSQTGCAGRCRRFASQSLDGLLGWSQGTMARHAPATIRSGATARRSAWRCGSRSSRMLGTPFYHREIDADPTLRRSLRDTLRRLGWPGLAAAAWSATGGRLFDVRVLLECELAPPATPAP